MPPMRFFITPTTLFHAGCLGNRSVESPYARGVTTRRGVLDAQGRSPALVHAAPLGYGVMIRV